MKRNALLLFLILILAQQLWAGAFGSVSSGNNHYKKGEYDKSLDNYREAQIFAPDNSVIHFNIGDALSKTGSIDESNAEFSSALNSKDKLLKSKAYYNLGNNAFSQEKPDEALDYYKKCLDLNPNDMDAKYNIEYIVSQKNMPKDKKKDKNDKDKKDNKDDKNKQKQQSKDDKDNKDKDKNDKNSMSKEDAQRILQYYNDQDKKSAEKRKMRKPELPKVEEDW